VFTIHIGLRAKNKAGTASILGTIIFIGIMFSAIIPMYLVMNQADTVFEQEKHEIANLDEERAMENIIVYAYPKENLTSPFITVKMKNECSLNVEGVRVWINNNNYSISVNLDPSQEITIDHYNVNPQSGETYDVRVTTERGNVFECSSGLLSYSDTGWEVETQVINVLISSPGVVFKVSVYWEDGEDNWLELPISPAQVWKIGGSAFKSFDVTNYELPENFKVVVKRGSNIIHEEIVTMEWPDGPSVVWVYA
jgi:hypothetical protein